VDIAMNHFSRLVVLATVTGASLASFGASAALNPTASNPNPNQVMEKLNPRDPILYETARLEALDGGVGATLEQLQENATGARRMELRAQQELNRANQELDRAQRDFNEKKATWRREQEVLKGVKIAGLGLLVVGLMGAMSGSGASEPRKKAPKA